MAGTKTYNREKATPTNSTGMVFTILVSEQPDGVGAIGGTGTTGILESEFHVDADESGGTDIQTHAKFTIEPKVDSGTGITTYTVTFTPVKGDANDGVVQVKSFAHDENMDVWQTAAGRVKQA